MKFKQNLHIAKYLGNMLADMFCNLSLPVPDSIIPVPLHFVRLIARGYNQSIELAKPLTKKINVKLDTQICKRIRFSQPQMSLPFKKRKKNVLNAFAVTNHVPYEHVLLVDDVITTGATINELSRVLHLAGVKRIDVLACAKTDFSGRKVLDRKVSNG